MPDILRTDNLNPDDRRRTMQQVRSINTKPEMAVRKLLHRLGYRYRLHRSDLPGKPDLVFARKRKVIFVHGCFWHSHDCKAGRKRPRTNEEYWNNKLEKNRLRDQAHQTELQSTGWQVLNVWECEVKELDKLRSKLITFLENDANESV
jgi:DNA mismatch endonuclease (patch repair protein)